MQSLKDLLSSCKKWVIQQENEYLFCLNQDQEKLNITHFKDELTKILKQFTQQYNKIMQNFNSMVFDFGLSLDCETTKFEGLEFKNYDDQLENYISLLLGLQNKQEEFIIEIRNPFLAFQENDIDLYAEKMIITKRSIQQISEIKWSNEDKIQNIIDKLNDHGFNKIFIDSIYIIIDKQIAKKYVHDPDDTYYQKKLKINRNININMSEINFNNLKIEYNKNYENEFNLSINLSIVKPIKYLQIDINKTKMESDKFSIDIIYLNEQCYISKLIFILDLHPKQFQQYIGYKNTIKKYYQRNYEKEEILKLFNYKNISEYKLNLIWQYSNLLDDLMQIDSDCQKIIYYSVKNKNELMKEFIELRNYQNSIKYQIISFFKLVSTILLYSPSITLFDIYQEFQDSNINQFLNNNDYINNNEVYNENDSRTCIDKNNFHQTYSDDSNDSDYNINSQDNIDNDCSSDSNDCIDSNNNNSQSDQEFEYACKSQSSKSYLTHSHRSINESL